MLSSVLEAPDRPQFSPPAHKETHEIDSARTVTCAGSSVLALLHVRNLGRAGDDAAVSSARRLRWLVPLATASAANYGWQVPYAVHQYGHRWSGLPRLSLALVVTAAWLVLAMVQFAYRRPLGRVLLSSFLVTETAFYLVHDLSGAFMADLPGDNPIVLIASLLGYVNTIVAGCYLWALWGGGPRYADMTLPRED